MNGQSRSCPASLGQQRPPGAEDQEPETYQHFGGPSENPGKDAPSIAGEEKLTEDVGDVADAAEDKQNAKNAREESPNETRDSQTGSATRPRRY